MYQRGKKKKEEKERRKQPKNKINVDPDQMSTLYCSREKMCNHEE